MLAIIGIASVAGSSPTRADGSSPRASLGVYGVPSEVRVGERFEIRIRLRNRGGAGDQGGVTVAFPEIRRGRESSSDKFRSAVADVEAVRFTDGLRDVDFYARGDTIWASDDTEFDARHLLVEADSTPWRAGRSRMLTLAVAPNAPGKLEFQVRGWICLSRYSECARDPSGGSRRDQQGYPVRRFSVDVVEPSAKLTACRVSTAQASTEQGVRLKARVALPDSASRQRFEVRFRVDGEEYTEREWIDPGDSETVRREILAPSEAGEYRVRCSLYDDDGDRVGTEYATLRVIAAPAAPSIVSRDPSSMRITVDPGETIRFSAAAEDADGDISAAQWEARHSLIRLARDEFAPSPRRRSHLATSFPIEGDFSVSVVFYDERGASSAKATWDVRVDDGREDLASVAGQLANLNHSYEACLGADEAGVCRGMLERNLGPRVRYLVEEDWSRATQVHTQSSLIQILLLGTDCGQVCFDLGLPGTERPIYSVGWMLSGFIVLGDVRDTQWVGLLCLDTNECEEDDLIVNLIGFLPGLGDAVKAAKIRKHVNALRKRGTSAEDAADFVRVASKPLDKADKNELMNGLRNGDLTFPVFIRLQYPNVRVKLPSDAEGIEDVPGFDKIRTALMSSRESDRLGAHRQLKALESEQYRGMELVRFSREFGPKKRRAAEVDTVLFDPKDKQRVWIESHGLSDDPAGKAERLLRGADMAVATKEDPGRIVYDFHADVFDDETLERVAQSIRDKHQAHLDSTGRAVDASFRINGKPAPPPTSTREAATGVATAAPTAIPTVTAAPAPLGHIQVEVCNLATTSIWPEIAVGLWESSAPAAWVRGDEVGAGDCKVIYRQDHPDGEYQIRARTRFGELSSWANIVGGNNAPPVTIDVVNDGAAPTRNPTATPTSTPEATATPMPEPTVTAAPRPEPTGSATPDPMATPTQLWRITPGPHSSSPTPILGPLVLCSTCFVGPPKV